MSIKKKSIRIKIICSSPSSNITPNMAYICGLRVSSFSITPTRKAQYHLLGSIFTQASWFSFCPFSGDYSLTRYWMMLLQDVVPCSGYLFLIVWLLWNLKKCQVSPTLQILNRWNSWQQLILAFLRFRDFPDTRPALLLKHLTSSFFFFALLNHTTRY